MCKNVFSWRPQATKCQKMYKIPAKVKAMVVSRKKSPPRPPLQLYGQPLECVTRFKLLRVTITSDLSWSAHIAVISSRAKQLLGFIFHVFRHSGHKCLSSLYKAIVLPLLEYCCCVWDPPHNLNVNRLERILSNLLPLALSQMLGQAMVLISGLILAGPLCSPDVLPKRFVCATVLSRIVLSSPSLSFKLTLALVARTRTLHLFSSLLFEPTIT